MTPIEKQILENQLFLVGNLKIDDFQDSNAKSLLMKNTLKLLETKESKEEEPCCEMPEEFAGQNRSEEVKEE